MPLNVEGTCHLLIERLQKQPPSRAELATRIVVWLAYAERRLTLSELQQAVSIDPYVDTGEYDPNQAFSPDNLPFPQLIEDVSLGLLTVDQEQNTALPVHASLVHYLRLFRDALFPTGNDYVARCVVSFIGSSCLSGGFTHEDDASQKQQQKQRQEIPLLDYMGKFWGCHIKRSRERPIHKASDILHDDQRRALLCRILHASDLSEDFPDNFSPLHFMAYFDLPVAIWRSSSADGVGESAADTCDSWGRTPLHIACQRAPKEHMTTMGRGHGRPTQPSARSIPGTHLTTLQDVPSGQQDVHPWQESPPLTDICRFLVLEARSLAKCDRHLKTPLHYASIQRSTTIARALADRLMEGEISILDDDGRTPLDYAAENGNLELVDYLLKRCPETPWQALPLAALNGHIHIVSALLRRGYHTLKDRAVLEASRGGHYEIAHMLVQHHPNIKFRGAGDMTPLHYASFARDTELAFLLFGEGADIHALDNRARSPLHLAAERGNTANVKFLVQLGARRDLIDSTGRTPFDLAVENGHAEVLEYLMPRTFRLPAPLSPQREMSPLQISCKLGFEASVAVLLKSSGPDQSATLRRTPLSLASENGHAGIVQLLLETKRVNANLRDERGRAALIHAARRGHADVVRRLLAVPNIQVDAMDGQGRTALSYAVETGPNEATILLLQRLPRSDLFVMDDEGKTPIDYAVKHEAFHEYLKVLSHLQENDAPLPPLPRRPT